MIKALLIFMVLASSSLAAEKGSIRARVAQAMILAEGPVDEPGVKGEAGSNAIQFDLSCLAKMPQQQGEWRAVQVCPGNGQPCYWEQRWVPIQGTEDRTFDPTAINDALDELNAQRAQRGLRPYIRDENLTRGAQAAANARAAALLFEHTDNDFRYLPAGTSAAAAGCAAYPASYGFIACAMYENWTYAGAAFAMGRDGKRYCHLFVR